MSVRCRSSPLTRTCRLPVGRDGGYTIHMQLSGMVFQIRPARPGCASGARAQSAPVRVPDGVGVVGR